ncbi:hypothetical protein [Micromonospora endolithica]|nr:hypothetical protein [Micromonospora endolithica]TWJ25786.1 hypothetical protein JD76_05960 [Micromonospora endolithica]
MSKHSTSDAAMAEVTRRMREAARATESATPAERERAVIEAASKGGTR